MSKIQEKTWLRVAILGFSREGRSVLTYLKKHPHREHFAITICDANARLKKEEKGVMYVLGSRYLSNLSQYDIVVRSPGIPYLRPEIQRAKRAGVIITSATQIFFEEIARYKREQKRHTPKIVGITGTKGKGTVSTMIFQMLRASKQSAILAGNIGVPMLENLQKAKRCDVVVLELSSFQLHDMSLSPDVAVVLPITPDHLDHHKNMAEYIAAKSSIARNQKAQKDAVFFFKDSPISKRIAAVSAGKKIAVDPKAHTLFTVNDIKLVGAHSFYNAVMASAVARYLGASQQAVRAVAMRFTGLQHRLQFVNSDKNILFYDDSAGTNPETASAAILSFSVPTILIAGGKDKGLDYKVLARAVKKSTVTHVVLFGENQKKIALALRGCGKYIVLASTLHGAVKKAHQLAEYLTGQEVAVVFSPASASFDMFSDYVARGKAFQEAVRLLIKGK